jgi:hypothetical protein
MRADHFRFRDLRAFMSQARQEHTGELDFQLLGFGVAGAISSLEMPLYGCQLLNRPLNARSGTGDGRLQLDHISFHRPATDCSTAKAHCDLIGLFTSFSDQS